MWKLATSQNDAEIMNMCSALYLEDPSLQPAPHKNISETLGNLRDNPVRGRAVVCVVNDQIVGYSLLISFWSNEYGGELCFVDELFVKPVARGKGLASLLMETLKIENSFWPSHPPAILLEVTPGNIKARELYLKLGFVPAKNSTMIFRT